MRIERTAWVFVGFSPLVFLSAALIGATYRWAEAGAWIGCVAVYVPLAVLVRSRLVASYGAKTVLWIALASGVCLIPAAVLSRAPKVLLKAEEPVPAAVTLTPIRGNAWYVAVSGLSLRHVPKLEKMDANLSYQFRLSLSVAHGETTLAPPGSREDVFGNAISMTQPARDRVRIEDDQGGFAEIHWDGKQFVVDRSKGSRKSAAARGPSPGAIQLANAGAICFVLALGWCWLLLALFLRVYRPAQSQSATGASASFLLQLVGVVLWVFLLLGFDRAGPGNEIPLTPFFAVVTSGLGLLLLIVQWRTTKDNWLRSPSMDE